MKLTLDDDLLSNIINWMQPKYAKGTILRRTNYLKSMFKKYIIYDRDVLRKIMKTMKYQHERACLVMINKYCYDNEIDFNIMIPSIKKQANKIPEILSLEEVKLMIEAAPKPYDLCIRCIFNMGAGLRISEIIKFSWDHIRWVDWINNKESYGVATIKSGKGSKDRVVNIPNNLMIDLYKYAKEENVLNEFEIPTGSMIFDFGGIDYKSKLRSYDIEQWKFEYVKSKYNWFRYNILSKCEKALNKRIKIHSLRHCVSRKTEILTINGWKNYKELSIGDVVFSYNLNTDCIEKDKIRNISIYNYDGELERIKNSYLDEIITPEHKIIIKEITRKNKPQKYSCKRFCDVNKKTWNISHKLSSIIKDKDETIGISKAGILGWILSDGAISKRNHPSISISQSYSANKDKCEYLEELFLKSKIKYTKTISRMEASGYSKKPYIMCNFQIMKGGNHVDCHNWIYEYINKDRTPILKNILMLGLEELKELYNCMMLGDGTNLNYNSREYCGQDSKRIELIRILCVLLGHTSIQKHKKYINKIYSRVHIVEKKDYTQISKHKGHFLKELYHGDVWCPETTNHTFIAKNNDKIFVTGNSRATYLYEVEKVPVEKIQILLGHASINTTMLYTKINPRGIFESIKDTMEI